MRLMQEIGILSLKNGGTYPCREVSNRIRNNAAKHPKGSTPQHHILHNVHYGKTIKIYPRNNYQSYESLQFY